MIEFVCIFFPAFFSLRQVIDEKDEHNLYKLIFNYVKYTIYINLVVLVFLLITKEPWIRFNEDMFSIKMTFIYLIISVVVANYLPKVIDNIKSNVRISIKRKKHEEKNKNHS